jgi:voltage-gated potassium channel
MRRLRDRVYHLLEVESGDTGLDRFVNIALSTLIAASVVSVIVETVEPVRRAYGGAFRAFELITVAVFSVEYVLRVWVCVDDPRYAHPVFGRLRYLISPMALIDLVSVLPSLIPGGLVDLRFMRSLRLLRLLRALKLVRYSRSLQLIVRVVRLKREQLLATLTVGLTVLLLASCAIYYLEREAQPEAFSSIPASMWWGVVTLTTVGYGDVFPVTIGGRVLAAVIAMVGVGLFALPAGIVASGFTEAIEKPDDVVARCPHCGRDVHTRT